MLVLGKWKQQMSEILSVELILLEKIDAFFGKFFSESHHLVGAESTAVYGIVMNITRIQKTI